MQTITELESHIVSLHRKKQHGVDLHCHFEGSLTYADLQECARSIDSSLVFSTETWSFIKATMSSEEKSLANFFTRLTGRWIRLLAIVSFMKFGVPIETSYAVCMKKVLSKFHGQGLGLVELMVSVYTLSTDGDLSQTPIPEQTAWDEKTYIPQWNMIASDTTFTTVDLLTLFHTVIKEHKNCVPQNMASNISAENAAGNMVVGLKYMIRREKETHFRNSNSNLEQEMSHIFSLVSNGIVVGIDIAGNEYDEQGSVSNYASFIQLLKKHAIPFTIHAGEIAAESPKKNLGYDNLKNAVHLGAHRIGHAVRLFDHTPEMIALLKEVLSKNIYLELNATSNIWTGAVSTDSIKDHPFIQALNGNHPLFEDNPKLLQKLRERVVVCDDDPVVVSQIAPSLAIELAQVANATQFLGLSSLEALLEQQYTNAIAAKL